MNKLILLNEIKKEKSKNNLLEYNKISGEQENYKKSYITFKEKFNCFQDKEEIIDLNSINDKKNKCNKNEKSFNKIVGRIFSLDNDMLIINFINSIYDDELSPSTKIQYINNKQIISNGEKIILKNNNHHIRILAEDEYKKIEYIVQFQAKDDENLAIAICKIDLILTDNIINFNKKKKQYNMENNFKENYDKCLIMLNSNIEVPDVYECKSDENGKDAECKVNIIKSWKYDFKQLFEKNMYLLFPIKVLDLKQRLVSMSNQVMSKNLIKDEILRFFKDMNRYLNKIKDINLITDKDIGEFNLIAVDLLNNFIEKSIIFVDIKRDIEATLKDIVV